MTDYLHELQFGVFVPPIAEQADAVVQLAELAEVSGLDLVTFQDHPYQARFLDTWTLLSVIAAKTSTVRLAPNVANLPLRPPAVLARSVASLDILSSGRVELGLGAVSGIDAPETGSQRHSRTVRGVDTEPAMCPNRRRSSGVRVSSTTTGSPETSMSLSAVGSIRSSRERACARSSWIVSRP